MSTQQLTRRQLLVGTAAAGGGLLLGFRGVGKAHAAGAGGTLNAFVKVADGTITVVVPASEMGQGTHTALAQIVAEELLVDWSRVRVEMAPVAPVYDNPIFGQMLTVGSGAIRGYYVPMRRAAAAAREMLITAAAQRLGADRADLFVQDGTITMRRTGQSATYGELAMAAAAIPPPQDPPLVARASFRLIGKSLPRVDIPAKVDGTAVFGQDVRLPGMLYAAVRLCPTFGGTLGSYSRVPPGMTAVPLPNGVAVIASTTTWDAVKAARHLRVTWNDPPYAAEIETEAMKRRSEQLMASGQVRTVEEHGDPDSAIADAGLRVSASYYAPYVPHVCMESMNATAVVRPDSCEIWAPTQGQNGVLQAAMRVTGLPATRIKVHTTYLGKGLGRKSQADYVEQALIVAKALPGTPVKLTWTREDDFTHDWYRPAARAAFEAGLDASGRVVGWVNRIVGPGIIYQLAPGLASNPNWVDSTVGHGATQPIYQIGAHRVEWVHDPIQVPIWFWRSVAASTNVFFVESFIDELAKAANQDPIVFRRTLLAGRPRELAVLSLLAEKSNWFLPAPAGRARGVGFFSDTEGWGTVIGMVAEVSASRDDVKVHHVTCVVDPGLAIDPANLAAQIEGGMTDGLATALWGEMTFAGGAATRRNFNTYKMLRMKDMPAVAVHIIQSSETPGGIGELGVPPIAPAVANALARLTGIRHRALPLVPGTADDS